MKVMILTSMLQEVMEAKDINVGDGDGDDIDYGDLQEFSLNTSHETTTRDEGEERLQKTGHIRDDIGEIPWSDSLTDFLIVRNDEDSDEDEGGMIDDIKPPNIDTDDQDNKEKPWVSDLDIQNETCIENKPLINHCDDANVKTEPCDIESYTGQTVLHEGNAPSYIEYDIGRPTLHEGYTPSYIESHTKEPVLHEGNTPSYEEFDTIELVLHEGKAQSNAESNPQEPVIHKERTSYDESNTRVSVEHEEKNVLRDCFVSLSYLNISMTECGHLQCLKCKSTFKKASVLEKHVNLNNCDKKQSARSATRANSLPADVNVKQEYEELDKINTLQEGFTLQADTVYVCTLCNKTFPSLVEYLDHQNVCQMKATSAVKHEPHEEVQIKEEPCSSEPSREQPVITGNYENGRLSGSDDSSSGPAAKRKKVQKNGQPSALSRSYTRLQGKIPETWSRAKECTLCQQQFRSHQQLGEHMATVHVELEHDLDLDPYPDLDPSPDLDPIEMDEVMTEELTLDKPHDKQNGTSDFRENFRVNKRTEKNAGSITFNRGSKPDKQNDMTAKGRNTEKDKSKHVKHNDKQAKEVNRADKGRKTTKKVAKHVPGGKKVSVKAKTVTVKHGTSEKRTTLTVKQAIRRKIIESLKMREVARQEMSQDGQLSDPRVMKCFFNDCHKTFMSEIEFKTHLKDEFQKLNVKIKTLVRSKGKIGVEGLRHYLKDLDFNIVVFSCNHPGCGQMFIDLAECHSHYDTHQELVLMYVCEKVGCNQSFTSKYKLRSHVIGAHLEVKEKPFAQSLKDPQRLVQEKKLNEVLSSSTRERLKIKVSSTFMSCFFENCTKMFMHKEQFIEHIKKEIYKQNEKLEAGEQLRHKIGKADLVKHLYEMQLKVVVYFCNQLSCGQIFFDSEQVKIHQTTPHGRKLDFNKFQNVLDHVETKTKEIPEDSRREIKDMAKIVTPDSTDMTEILIRNTDMSIISYSHGKDTLSTPRTQGLRKLLPKPLRCSTPRTKGFPSALNAHADTETAKKAKMVRTDTCTCNTTVSETLNSAFPKGSAKPVKTDGLKQYRKLLPKPLSCSRCYKECKELSTPRTLGTPSVPCGSAKPNAYAEKREKQKPLNVTKSNSIAETMTDWTSYKWHEWVKSSEKGGKGFVWRDIKSKVTVGSDGKAGSRDSGTGSKTGSRDSGTDSKAGSRHSGSVSKAGSRYSGSDSKAGSRDSGTDRKAGSRYSGSDSKAGSQDSGTFKCCFSTCREVYRCEKELQQHIQKRHLHVEFRQFKSPSGQIYIDTEQVKI